MISDNPSALVQGYTSTLHVIHSDTTGADSCGNFPVSRYQFLGISMGGLMLPLSHFIYIYVSSILLKFF